MDKSSRQAALNNISSEDLAKIKAHQASTKGAFAVDNEWLLLTEFALKFGWQSYLDVKDDKISMNEMLTLIEASRRIDSLELFNATQAAFIGAVSANSKKPSSTFAKLTKELVKRSRANP